jgi:hypothetical protein
MKTSVEHGNNQSNFTMQFTIQHKDNDLDFGKTAIVLPEDILHEWQDAMKLALELRMQHCVSDLYKHRDSIYMADERMVGYTKNKRIKIFYHASYCAMEEALSILNQGKIDRILEPRMVDQIIKGLFWIPEEIKNSNRKYGFGELISLLTSVFIYKE